MDLAQLGELSSAFASLILLVNAVNLIVIGGVALSFALIFNIMSK